MDTSLLNPTPLHKYYVSFTYPAYLGSKAGGLFSPGLRDSDQGRKNYYHQTAKSSEKGRRNDRNQDRLTDKVANFSCFSVR
jgi:hypothetical protein